MYEKILIPLDGSELSELALPYVEELAGRLGSDVTLLAVTDSAGVQDYNKQQIYIQQRIEAAKSGIERYADKQKGKEIKVEPAILVGRPAEEIVDYADKEGIDLIVMATHGRSGISRWALGSVADKVVRATKRPVALIRAKGARTNLRERGGLNRILVPLDGSKESEAVIPHIEEIAARLNIEVIFLLVVGKAYHVEAVGDGVAQIPYSEKEMEPLVASAESYIQKRCSLFEGRGIATTSAVKVGSAAEEIIKLTDEIRSDMVAMSTHGRSGISRWTLGSVASKVLHGGNTPVLLVKVPEADT